MWNIYSSPLVSSHWLWWMCLCVSIRSNSFHLCLFNMSVVGRWSMRNGSWRLPIVSHSKRTHTHKRNLISPQIAFAQCLGLALSSSINLSPLWLNNLFIPLYSSIFYLFYYVIYHLSSLHPSIHLSFHPSVKPFAFVSSIHSAYNFCIIHPAIHPSTSLYIDQFLYA